MICSTTKVAFRVPEMMFLVFNDWFIPRTAVTASTVNIKTAERGPLSVKTSTDLSVKFKELILAQLYHWVPRGQSMCFLCFFWYMNRYGKQFNCWSPTAAAVLHGISIFPWRRSKKRAHILFQAVYTKSQSLEHLVLG